MLDTIEAWCNEERPLAGVPVIPGNSHAMKVVKVEDLCESILISFALEDEEILLEQDGVRFQVYSSACA